METGFPKSICRCGHSGDGPNSQHADRLGGISPGHGSCQVVGCSCIQFSWDRFVSITELSPHPTQRIYEIRGKVHQLKGGGKI